MSSGNQKTFQKLEVLGKEHNIIKSIILNCRASMETGMTVMRRGVEKANYSLLPKGCPLSKCL